MIKESRQDERLAALDDLIVEITVDAYGDDEKLWAFRQAFEDDVPLPADAFVISEPVSVVDIDYDGNERRGLTARCRREDGSEHEVAASDVVFSEGSAGALYVGAYRKWLNIDPFPNNAKKQGQKREHKADADDVDLSQPVELVVMSVKTSNVRCRLLGSDRTITLRAKGLWELVPGCIATVEPQKMWHYAGHPYLSGDVVSTRIDAVALGLVPLALEDWGTWDPGEQYWGEEDEPLEDWVRPIIARGPRPHYEMEQVRLGVDSDDPFDDPIIRSNDLKDAGDFEEAEEILFELCQADLRCLDAHAHLGNLVFDRRPGVAIRHFEVGLRIGELSLGSGFDGVLPWGNVDNRPFLRCMYGYGLCLWRLGRFEEAAQVLNRMLWLNPSDNLGVRFIVDDVKAGTAWKDREGGTGEMEGRMDIRILAEIPPWEWPQDVGTVLLETLRDGRRDDSDRLIAAQLAGDYTVVNDELFAALLSIVGNGDEKADLRARAAIAMGPGLETADLEGFDDPDDVPISEGAFVDARETLREQFMDAGSPKEVRRRILEASVRAPQDWHREAIRDAYASKDEDWRLTAVFSMCYVRGFDEQILEALGNDNENIRYEAVRAAGTWELDAAWSHVSGIVTSERADKAMLLAAIEAVASIRPEESGPVLVDLTDAEDEDIAEAAWEAMAMAEGSLDDGFEDEDDDDFIF